MLAGRLAAAVEAQQRLSRHSPHVLQFTGGLQEDEQSFFIEHEPAAPLPLDCLFNLNSALPPAQEILTLSAGLFDALYHAHSIDQRAVHGGLCPGTILVTDQGALKVTDFGFAPAIAEALGEAGYIQLAVSPGVDGSPTEGASGVWEVLPPEVDDHDGRLCAFIDPDKYGRKLLRGFEPEGDIFAAGCILYLLAHHRHPYFQDDPQAHRSVEMAEYMAMKTPTRAFRKDLRESPDSAIRAWVDLVSRMVDRLPQNRLTAAQLLEAMADGTTKAPAAAGGHPARLKASEAPATLMSTAPPRTGPAAPHTPREQPAPTAVDRPTIRILEGFENRRAAMTTACLVDAQRTPSRRLLLLGLPQIRMGRNRTGNDIVLRVLPRSPISDHLTRRISGQKPHLILSLHEDGLYIADQDTTNGTELNHKPIKGMVRLPVDQPSEVLVGKALRLRMTPILESSSARCASPEPYDELGPTDQLWQWAAAFKLTALLIQRPDSVPEQEQYLVLYRWADCRIDDGFSVGAGNEVHSTAVIRLLRCGEQFWVENASGQKKVSLDGIPLKTGMVCPLVPGMMLKLGKAASTFAPFEQIGL